MPASVFESLKFQTFYTQEKSTKAWSSFVPVTMWATSHCHTWTVYSLFAGAVDNPSKFKPESTNHSWLTTRTEKQITKLTKIMAVSHRQSVRKRQMKRHRSFLIVLWLMWTGPVYSKHMLSFRADTAQWDTEAKTRARQSLSQLGLYFYLM